VIFSRFIPTVKKRFDYGVIIFILIYSLTACNMDKLAG
jgi:hypothetical protein